MGNQQEFLAARAAYRQQRWEQRRQLVSALKQAGFKVKTGGGAGRGRKNYTSGGRLNPPFDLSDWLWVQGSREGTEVTVSLQVLDCDPHSGNVHALLDRIGVDVYRDGDPVDPDDPLYEKATTQFELPLSDEDVAALVKLIEDKAAALQQ
ncbi:hypothetical protein [Buchananella hordeovulneris]|uniref:hypothetical protein n=1 Tax=Buchananella hordeovulneris TaxID=52770 RepID=UPI0026DD2B07|nr:hypothetical protein [Buchananella hordeovulneris]MDO5080120.1 hypothetical protein [Buchananella hordeovulneris]